ncbi:MAG: hypothetical protein QXN83_06705 [Nitrososphaerales archaeon]
MKLDSRYIINKGVETSDGVLHEYIVSQTDNDITVLEGVWRIRKYIIPKSLITRFDGSTVYLSIADKELREKYQVK